MDQRKLMELWSNWRKPIIAGLAALSVAAVLIISVMTWGAYKILTLPQVVTNAETADIKGAIDSGNQLGKIRDFGVIMTREILAESLHAEDMSAFLNGLACVDAIGGPRPETVIKHLRAGISDQTLIAQIETIETHIAAQTDRRGPSSCITWLLKS